ncbi:MAG: hypothetical protein AAFY08_05120 [Planctomycetota bacterium]
MPMWIETFGFLAVAAMVTFYALESRGRAFILAFAIACLAAATYATLIGSWPFAAVEFVWAIVAFVRWRRRGV